MPSFITRNRLFSVAIIIFSFLFITGIVVASTTISTNIVTGGVLTVSGTATSSFAGAVGIGTTTLRSGTSLHVVGLSSADVLLEGPASAPVFTLYNDSGGTNSVINEEIGHINFTPRHNSVAGLEVARITGRYTGDGTTRTGQLLFLTSNSGSVTSRMTITGPGNVGIGTSSPIARLAVTGAGTENPFAILSSTNASMLTVLTGGNVGIGTSTPTTQLQVTALASNATTTFTVGKSGQNKGSCLELFDAGGTAVYAYVAAGATTFTLSAASCK